MKIQCSRCDHIYNDGLYIYSSEQMTLGGDLSSCPNCGKRNRGLVGVFNFDEHGNPTTLTGERPPIPKKIGFESDLEFHFVSAVRYDLAGQILLQEKIDTKNPDLVLPASVLDSFSIELYLKLLLKLQKHVWKGKRVHSLVDLYSKLTSESKTEIEALYTSQIYPIPEMQDIVKLRQASGSNRKFGLYDLMDEANKTFETYRYLHEPETRSNYRSFFGMPLKLTFRRYILTLHPEWELHEEPRMIW